MSYRRSYHKADLDAVVFGAVRRLILRGGLAAVTLRPVATEASTSTGALRTRWPDKATLVQSFGWSAQEALARGLIRRYVAHADPWEAVVHGVTVSLPANAEDRADEAVWLVLRTHALTVDDDVRKAVDELEASRLTYCRRTIHHLGVPADQAEDETRTLHALVEGLRQQLGVAATVPDGGLTSEHAHALVDRHLRRLAAAYGVEPLPTRP